MCEIISAFLFIAGLVVQVTANDFNKFICLIVASGIFAIAGSLYSLNKDNSLTINATYNENDKK